MGYRIKAYTYFLLFLLLFCSTKWYLDVLVDIAFSLIWQVWVSETHIQSVYVKVVQQAVSHGQFLYIGTPVFDSECCSQFIWRSCLYHLPFLSLSSTKECSKYANVSITQTPFFSFFLLIMSPLTLRCMLCERLSLLPSDLYIYMSGWTLRNECCIQTGTEGKLFK